MTVQEAINKYGENEADVITFAMFLLMTSKLSIDPSEVDTYVGLVQNLLGTPYFLYFVETVSHTEAVTITKV